MTLKWTLVTKRMRPHGQLQKKLQEKISKLETHLEHFPSDAEKQGPDPVPALDLAVKALLREIAVLKSALRRESQWPRVAGAKLLHPAGMAQSIQPVARV